MNDKKEIIDDKKERILKVAEEFFAQFGIKKTTMDEIAKKVRIGKSTLYYYFKSKTHIFNQNVNFACAARSYSTHTNLSR